MGDILEQFSFAFEKIFNFITSNPFIMLFFLPPILLSVVRFLLDALGLKKYYSEPIKKIEVQHIKFDIVEEEKKPVLKARIKLPNNCVNCGAPLTSHICEYCGTDYYKKVV